VTAVTQKDERAQVDQLHRATASNTQAEWLGSPVNGGGVVSTASCCISGMITKPPP
jgi:hypothetical protein